VETDSISDHATHVAGTLGGDGTLSLSKGGTAGQWRGIATNVDFYSYGFLDNNLEPEEHDGAINTYGIDLSQNSWTLNLGAGSTQFGDYTSRAVKYDKVVRGVYGRRIPIFFAAGNDRDKPGRCGTGYNCIPPPGSTAKNIVTVGATNSDDDSMPAFSGWGPVDDGRLKPEVVAPGCESIGETYIKSTLPGDTYGGPGWCGTSMAAPVVSGVAALIIQQYRTCHAGNDPLPSTVKALLVHGAVDLDDDSSYYNPGPDYASGYGRIDAQASVDLVKDGKVREDVISADDEWDWYSVQVTSSLQPLKVTLAWDDWEGTVNANTALVNDLHLRLYYGSKWGDPDYYAWTLDRFNPSDDADADTYNFKDPLEQIVVNNPTPGTYFIAVWGWEVPNAPQKYSLVSEHFPLDSCDEAFPWMLFTPAFIKKKGE
jgi:subtilisin family serine protease